MATALAAGGCGGGGEARPPESGADQRGAVQRLVAAYVGDVLGGRGHAACSRYTPELRETIDRRARSAGLGDCARAVAKGGPRRLATASPEGRAKLARQLADPGAVRADVREDRASAALRLPGGGMTATRVALVRGQTGWRISGVGARGP
jgi:hypothetical protein